jgi:Protein of unknown function (DUF2806)
MDGQKGILNIGDLAQPVTTLIEKVADATGVIFEPWKIKRNAKAEAEANLIKVKSNLEISDLQRRGLQRFVQEEGKKQENIENIIEKTIPLLEEGSKPEKIDDDWLMNYVDKAKLVSDEEMKTLWAKILAGEANEPNSFSKRTVNFLASMDKKDAEVFTGLCSFIVTLKNDPQPFIFDSENQIYNNAGITFLTLSHLESISLINFNAIGFAKKYYLNDYTDLLVRYFDEHFHAKLKRGNTQISTGKVLFTQIGQELSKLCESKKIEDFFEYLFKQFSENIAVETVKCNKNDVIN